MTPRPEFSAARWFTSSHTQNGGQCVEVAVAAGWVGVRDSKERTGPRLAVSDRAWTAFLCGLRNGEFNLRDR